MQHSKRYRKRYSDMWNYFTEYKPGRALCNSCREKISYKSTISNLKAHLSRKHPEIEVKTGPKERHALVELVDMGHFEANNSHEDRRSPSVNNNSSNEFCPSTSSSEEEASLKPVNRSKKKSRKAHPITIKHEVDLSDTNNTRTSSKNTRRKNNVNINNTPNQIDKVDAYAVSMSLRLEQLESNQRFIAEKLISDVIFYGRFGKLSEEAQVMLSNNNLDQNSPGKQNVFFKYNGRTIVLQEHEIDDKPNDQESSLDVTENKMNYKMVES